MFCSDQVADLQRRCASSCILKVLNGRAPSSQDLEELKVTLAQRNTRAANAAHRSRRSERAEKAAAARDGGAGGSGRCSLVTRSAPCLRTP